MHAIHEVPDDDLRGRAVNPAPPKGVSIDPHGAIEVLADRGLVAAPVAADVFRARQRDDRATALHADGAALGRRRAQEERPRTSEDLIRQLTALPRVDALGVGVALGLRSMGLNLTGHQSLPCRLGVVVTLQTTLSTLFQSVKTYVSERGRYTSFHYRQIAV